MVRPNVRLPVRALVVVLAAVSASCEARLAPGASCVRSSDCASPLVCASGRCRSECGTHRDCSLGARCIVGTDGQGVCTLADDACAVAADCGDGLVCQRGACFDGCTVEDCPAGGTCRAGVCERRDVLDGGVAAPLPCGSDADCTGGDLCVTLTSIPAASRHCRRSCVDSGDCLIAGGSSECVLADHDGVVVPVCSLGCDPLGRGECPEGETCDLLTATSAASSSDTAVLECRAVLDRGVQGDSCQRPGVDSTLCDVGHSCEPLLLGGAWGCAQICAVDGSRGPACPGGFACSTGGLALRALGTPIGTCWPAP